jgi:iron complex transport system ATP-binding protein
MSDVLVSARGVGYTVDGAELLRGVDATVRSGEVVGVIGPNGAGKSTLVQVLAGDLRPTAGTVSISGHDVTRSTPAELALLRSVYGYRTPDDVPFTARSIVEMGRYPHRLREGNTAEEDLRSVRGAMERTATDDLAHRPFTTLSSGERARVLLARMLAQDAGIVLMDEPTANLDIRHGEHILSEARRLADAGRAVLSVFHDLNEAARYADRMLLLDRGAVRLEGRPQDVLSADVLSEVYGQALEVVDHPFLDCPLVLIKR